MREVHGALCSRRSVRGAGLLLFCLQVSAFAQMPITVSTQQCVWRAGDDLRWAAPELDSSAWKPYTQWKLNASEPRLWIRCPIPSIAAGSDTAIQIRLFAAYELYVDGEKIGGSGEVSSGNFSMDVMQTFPLRQSSFRRTTQSTISLRVTYRLLRLLPSLPLPPLEVAIGSRDVLENRRSSVVLEQGSKTVVNAICFSIIGVVGFVLFGLWLYDRSRRDLLLLTLICFSLPPIYLNYFCAAAMFNYPVTAYLQIWAVGALMANLTRCLSFFALAKRRVPAIYWVFVGIGTFGYVSVIFDLWLPLPLELQVETLRVRWFDPMSLIARIFESSAPFVAFWPFWKLERRTRALGILCMAWGVTMVAFFINLLANSELVGIPAFLGWGRPVANAEAFSTLAVILALLTLLFREQRQAAEERAILAGEMQAAREIQRMLAPEIVRTAPGVTIQVAFHPMREVGGDFFLCRVLPDGRQRLLLGDVSGKGSAAAMTAALLMGGAQARPSDSPGELLAHLNQVMCESRVSGFATCICADLARNGTLTVANAGHLPPYCKGDELQTPANLPLGIGITEEAYEQSEFTFKVGEAITFLSDGVVEARNAEGAMFGFERTRAISSLSAEEIAQAARSFGQEDDVTVLTLTLVSSTVDDLSDPRASVAAG